MRYGAADDRPDHAEHDGPRDRQMHVHQRLGDTTCEESDEEVPNEVKHLSVVTSPMWKFNPKRQRRCRWDAM